MNQSLDFPDLLRLIDERSAAFRAAVAAAPSLDVQVPSCPEWTLLDLVDHLGEGRRTWAAIVAAGPGAAGKAQPENPPARPEEREAIVAWLAESTRELLDALRDAGPDRGCWTWWGDSQSPETSGSVARHQLQSIAVHTYDAELTLGAPQPLPEEIALDGVDEFLMTCCSTTTPWPHEPVDLDYHATEGRSWRLSLSADGAKATRLSSPDGAPAGAVVTGTANELVLFMYGRIGFDVIKVDGDRIHFDRLIDWDPSA